MQGFPAWDRFRPVALLGRGASGRVYEVEDTSTGDRLALKLIAAEREADFEAAREEFRVLAELDHPQLARVVEFGRIGDHAWFTQTLVRGQTPQDWAATSPIRAAILGAQIAHVLDWVHRHGVVHLDVKPENVRMEDGRARLLDFGLARRPADVGRAGGTPGFMAPEVLSGRRFDHRADLYGVGALVYTLAAGRPPFVGGSVGELVEQVLFSEPLPLDGLRPDCPQALSNVVASLLRKDPARRPDSGAEVVQRLLAIEGVALPDLPPGRPACVGRGAEERRLDQARGLVWIRGPRGVGKRTLLRRRLQRAALEGRPTGIGRGRGLDGLEEAIRGAGGQPDLPDLAAIPAADARRARLDALLAAVDPSMVLGLIEPGDLPDVPVPAQILCTSVEPGEDGIHLEPFDRDTVRDFLQAARPGRKPDEPEVDRAIARTGGLPDLLALFATDPDASLDLSARTEGLDSEAAAALTALTLLPEAATAAEIARVAGLERPHAALVRLVGGGLATAGTDRRYRPQPDELRGALESAPVCDPEAVCAMAKLACALRPSLAAWRAAGDDEALCAALRTAADRTLELGTRRELLAELYGLERAPEDGLALERALEELGLRTEQGEVLDQLAERARDPELRHEIAVRTAFHRMWTGRDDEALDQARTARESGTAEVQARSWRVEGLVAQRRGDHEAASSAFAAARAALPQDGGDPILRAHAVHDLGVTALYLGRHAEGLPCFRESLRLKLRHGDRSGARIARQNIGICHEALGEPRLALRAWEESLTEARALGSLRGEAWNHMALGGLLRRLGRTGEAIEHLDLAEAVAHRLGQPLLVSGIAAERALLDGTSPTLGRVQGELERAGDRYNAERLGLERVALALREGREPEEPTPGEEHFPERHTALEALRAVRAGARTERIEGSDAAAAIAWAESLRAGGRPHEADRALREALERAWASDDRAWLGQALGESTGDGLLDGEARTALRILDVSRRLHSVESAAEVVDLVLDTAIEVTSAERGFLLVDDPGSGSVSVAAARNLDGEKIQRGAERVSHGIALDVLQTGEPVRIVDAQAESHRQAGESILELGLSSVLCVPLRGRASAPIGCLYLDHRFRRGAFGPRDVRFVELLSDQAALALDAARVLGATRAQAEEVQRLNRILAEREAATQAELENTQLLLVASRSELHTRYPYPGIVGRSPAFKRTLRLLDRVIPTTLSVLLEGESGTGKELLARAVHDGGLRARGPFVAVNCGAISRELVESSLFGHVKGAFTGADQSRPGFFALADGGTLLLDEIGELPLDLQPRLLRVLETGAFWPVGGSAEAHSDVRVVAATNRDLQAMCERSEFRSDLFYRIAQVRVPVPPLRERPDDIPLLVEAFLDGATITPDALRALAGYHWPGNARELRNELERARVLSGGSIDTSDLSEAVTSVSATASPRAGSLPPFHGDLKGYLDVIERRIVAEALERFEHNITRTAAFLGLSRYGLRKKITRLGL